MVVLGRVLKIVLAVFWREENWVVWVSRVDSILTKAVLMASRLSGIVCCEWKIADRKGIWTVLVSSRFGEFESVEMSPARGVFIILRVERTSSRTILSC